jgi:hypothetical protein
MVRPAAIEEKYHQVGMESINGQHNQKPGVKSQQADGKYGIQSCPFLQIAWPGKKPSRFPIWETKFRQYVQNRAIVNIRLRGENSRLSLPCETGAGILCHTGGREAAPVVGRGSALPCKIDGV